MEARGASVVAAERLAYLDAAELREFFGWSGELPQEAERVRLIREVRAPRPPRHRY